MLACSFREDGHALGQVVKEAPEAESFSRAVVHELAEGAVSAPVILFH